MASPVPPEPPHRAAPQRRFVYAGLLVAMTLSSSCGEAPQRAPSTPADPTPSSAHRDAPTLGGLTPCAKDAAPGDCSRPGTSARPGASEDEKTIWSVPVGPDDPVRGRRDALLTVVVFADFQCPFCKRESAELEELSDEYGRELRLVWKDCPSPAHEWAEPAAELARSVRAARGDEGFWKAHDLLYESQSELGQKLFRTIAEDLGLSWSTVRAEMTAAKYGLVIQGGVSLADRTAITATPTTFINGRKLVGLKSVGALKEVADAELERAKRLVAKGTPRERLYEQLISGGKQVTPPSDVPK